MRLLNIQAPSVKLSLVNLVQRKVKKEGRAMQTVNIHEAKTQLSRLIDLAVKGEPFIIAKAGKPLVKVERLNVPEKQTRRLGFMAGQMKVPDDFNTMGQEEIERLFYGEE